MLPVIVAQSFCGRIAMLYILPVLWITSCFSKLGSLVTCDAAAALSAG